MSAHRWTWWLLLMAVLAALETKPALAQTAQEALWTGQAQCLLTLKADGYAHQEIQTWTMSGQPRQQGAMAVYPGTWSTKGEGATQQAQGMQSMAARWTSIVSPMSAPIAILVRASDNRLIVKSWHSPLSVAGALSGVRQVSAGNASPTQTSMAASSGEWPFPDVEDDATSGNISGSGTVVVLGNLLPMQTASARGTANCHWQFSKGAASLPGVNANPADAALLHPSTEPAINPERQPTSARATVSQSSPQKQGGTDPGGGADPGGTTSGSQSSTQKQGGTDPGGGADPGGTTSGSQSSTQKQGGTDPGGGADPGGQTSGPDPSTQNQPAPATRGPALPHLTTQPNISLERQPLSSHGTTTDSAIQSHTGQVLSGQATGSQSSTQKQTASNQGTTSDSKSSNQNQSGGAPSMDAPTPTPAPGAVKLRWAAPASTGGAVDSYGVDVDSGSGTTQQTIAAPATTATVALAACPYPTATCQAPKTVRFRVRAHSSAGYGPYSDYTQWVRPLTSYAGDNINSIWPAKQCTSCHAQGSKLDLSGTTQHSYTNIVNANVIATPASSSLLLTCPTATGPCGTHTNHPGGKIFEQASPEYWLLLQWLIDGRQL